MNRDITGPSILGLGNADCLGNNQAGGSTSVDQALLVSISVVLLTSSRQAATEQLCKSSL